MTSKLTRDELNEVVSTYGKSHIAHRMAVELLAAMDSEPVAWTDEEELRDLRKSGFCEMFSVEPISKDADMYRVIPLYRHAQPAPVVPEEWTIADAVKFCKETGRQDAGAAMDAWNACRAAMLQASPVCTCPSGDGSLRWPCPVHPGSSLENPGCWCRTCRPVVLNDMRFVVCPD